MSPISIPVSMVASKGAGGALAAGVIGLLILLALNASKAPPASNQTVRR